MSWWPSRFPLPHYYSQDPFVFGPSQLDDLGLLFATIKEIRPRVLVEIGCHRGDSTRTLLSAADSDATLYSFDPAADSARYMRQLRRLAKQINASSSGPPLPTWVYQQLDGRAIQPAHVGGATGHVDFVFLDAGHRLEDNKMIFKALVPLLTDRAVVAIHDTGFWSKTWLDRQRINTTWRFGRWLTPREAHETWRVGDVHHGQQGEEYYLHPHNANERARKSQHERRGRPRRARLRICCPDTTRELPSPFGR
jgi:predicted O-methyltransferase YrrM